MVKHLIFIPMTAAAFGLDLLFGDPAFLYHPVRIIGHLISFLERVPRRIFPATKRGERTAGTILAILVILLSGGIPFAALYFCHKIHPAISLLLEVFWCWQMLACRSLQVESVRVYHDLKREEIEDARESVGRIVGRDTDFLDEPGIVRATVETIAENTSDGVVAPLCYMMLGGAVGAFVYKAVNTMDSMIGYKNERYHWFGTFAARLDDLLNLIPARLTALLMIVTAGGSQYSRAGAWKIFLRDRRKHASPNSARPESAMAGALGIRLAGDASYFGEIHHKPTLGDPLRECAADDILLANRLMVRASLAAIIILSLTRFLIVLFI